MEVREIMSRPAITVWPETEIRDVARIMRANQISGVPVVDEHGKLVGVITEIDLISRNAPIHQPQYIAVLSAMIPLDIDDYREYKEQLRQILAINAGDLMNDDVKHVSPDTVIETALEMMLDPDVTMLPVVDANHRVLGVVTRTDMVRLIELMEIGEEESGAGEES